MARKLFLPWLGGALRRILIRIVAVLTGLQAFNYLLGGDEEYKSWALASRGEIVIALVAVIVVQLMYEWLSRPPS